MPGWENEALSAFNDWHFKFVDSGPLHCPITSFKVSRSDKLNIMLTTTAPADAKSPAVEPPSGTVRINNERATLESIGGLQGEFRGIVTLSYEVTHDGGQSVRAETAKIYHASAQIVPGATTAYIIEWVANLSSRSLTWPDPIRTETVDQKTRTIGRDAYKLVLPTEAKRTQTGMGAAKINVEGVDIYVCCAGRDEDSTMKSASIIYVGNPTQEFRNKIRRALSFTLGTYLVHLGHTCFAADWTMNSFECHSAYSIDKRVFDLPVVMPASLHDKWQGGISNDGLQRSVTALFQCDERLNFADLSWAYWHALCATVHIAPVHWGAAIELLVRRYVESSDGRIPEKLVADNAIWAGLVGRLEREVDETAIPESARDSLKQTIRGANRVSIRSLMDAVLEDVGIVLGQEERRAWRRRNEAAHGMELEAGEELELIRDVKLLKVLFHRLLLGVSRASDNYIDQVTPGFFIRRIPEPVPDA